MAKLVVYVNVVLLLVSSVRHEDINLNFGDAEQHPAPDFHRHSLVKPKIHHGREKRQISSTKEESGTHVEYVELHLEVDGEDLILDLRLNKRLIPKGFFHKHQENGKYKITKPTYQEVNLCQYEGKVRNKPDSWVALSTCEGLSGIIFDGTEMHYIERNTNNLGSNLESEHFIYKHSDLKEHNKTCGYNNKDAHDTENQNFNRILRYKREANRKEPLRGPYNAKKDSKYVELVFVLDNEEYKHLSESKSKAVHHATTIANIINGLYSPLNIFIALVGVVIWTEKNEFDLSEDGDATLTNFLNYRRTMLVHKHPNDNAQLLTKFNFKNGVVGKALKGPMCTYKFSGGVNTDHSTVVGLVATTVAHEMGHNFGMEHDTTECHCADDRCIMAPSSSSVAPTHWSSCSLNYLLIAFTHGMDYCLKNKPEALLDNPVCGNSFVEPGEQCDCGLPEHCDNTCCNATTCMLHSNASCATGECCDLNTCMPKTAGTICRTAPYECDLPEYCTGQSEYCPNDFHKLDTEPCDDGRAYCYQGFCRTRSDQCKLLWGETGLASVSDCYDKNVFGNRSGNCGHDKKTDSFIPCQKDNVLCGMLHCRHLNERLEFGMESVAILTHSFINKKGEIMPCRTALVDLGINEIDPGLTPDGSICGNGKMCVNQKCMSVASLRKEIPGCPEDCNGSGWCNNLGHCHCKNGFAPPNCDYPGSGGSLDSGPTSDPEAKQGFVIAMFVIFLGIVPVIAVVSFLYYYGRHNISFSKKMTQPATSKSPSKSRGPSFPSENAKRTEDNHSLLHDDSPPSTGLQNEFFGNFRGFSISPAKKSMPEPVRSAPPPPGFVPQVASPNKAQKPRATVKPLNVIRSNTVAAKTSFFNKPVQKYNSFKNNTLSSGISATNGTSIAPALPPPNPGSNARPIISSPVLENSTCTAKELISPLKNAPKLVFRAAPEIPTVKNVENDKMQTKTVPNETTNTTIEVKVEEKKVKEKVKETKDGGNSTLNRITSFLRPADKKPVVTVQKSNSIKASKVKDKDALRSMKISNPIPQTKIDIAITALPVSLNSDKGNKSVVMRAQSMRAGKATIRPNIQTFGSMRQASGSKRPLSIPSGTRPKSPPPPRPPLEIETVAKKGGKTEQNQYDDCLNKALPLGKLQGVPTSPTSGDNIYAVIEESPVVSPLSPPEKVLKSTSGSSENMGLLGEIVSEIQNRNFDSIYSTSTLARKKKEAADKLKAKNLSPESDRNSSETYVNTSSLLYPDSEYSNMSGNLKSSASSTSSGYILPSAVNVPLKTIKNDLKKSEPKKSDQIIKKTDDSSSNLSTFKSDSTKPFSSTFNRQPGPLAVGFKSNQNSIKKEETYQDTKSKTPVMPASKTVPKISLNRQITPPNLRTKASSSFSPTRTAPIAPKSNRSVTNSPDLVTSCNANPALKPPDVLNGGLKKPSISSAKPTVHLNSTPKTAKNNLKSVSFKNPSPQEKKGDVKPPVVSKIGKANSDVGNSKNTGLRNAAKQSSNVASLQQKFEGKNSAVGKSTPKIKT